MTDLSDTIEEAAGDPEQVSADGISVKSRPIDQLIAADRYLASKTAASRNHFGLRFRKLEPSD